jgi:hypothetical protein
MHSRLYFHEGMICSFTEVLTLPDVILTINVLGLQERQAQ